MSLAGWIAPIIGLGGITIFSPLFREQLHVLVHSHSLILFVRVIIWQITWPNRESLETLNLSLGSNLLDIRVFYFFNFWVQLLGKLDCFPGWFGLLQFLMKSYRILFGACQWYVDCFGSRKELNHQDIQRQFELVRSLSCVKLLGIRICCCRSRGFFDDLVFICSGFFSALVWRAILLLFLLRCQRLISGEAMTGFVFG